jgi:hypothetical protein
MQTQTSLLANDPLVSAIFSAVADVPSEPFEKLRAISRAGKIAETYLPPFNNNDSRRVVLATFPEGGLNCSASPSEPQHARSSH